MTTHTLSRPFTWMLVSGALAIGSQAHAAAGYMAFLPNGPTGTSVTTGNAESYMRAGRDWDGVTIVGGIAVPTIIQQSIITTWKQGTDLHLKFVIPDATTTKSGGAALACGDQLIVQIGQANTAATALVQGQEFRFEVVILNSQIPGGIKKRLPRPNGDPLAGRWKAAAEASTAATVTPTGTGSVGSPYTFEITIPLSEIGNPAADFGLALAIINDLGHSHGSPAINEASGTAFPVGMGLTPESDPGLTCGALTSPSGETASGNWINPSTWGVGYVALPSVPPDVTLDQGPAFVLSRAIRLGRCSITDFNTIPEVTVANWQSIQQAVANNWYKYNQTNPCKMTIWIDAKVSAPGVVSRRFLAVWGRPGISPQGWYFVGMTNPVAVSAPSTAVSFTWNKPPAVTFSSHPCLRVYVLPDTPFTAAQQTAITNLQNDTSATGNSLTAFETAFAVAQGSSKSAQMNFDNIDTGSCTDASCMPTAALSGSGEGLFAQWSPISTLHAQVDDRPGPGDERSTLIRLILHGFGVADPQGDKPYMYVEDIGGLGWSVSNQVLAQLGTMPLPMQVSNPAITERMFVNGNAVDIRSPNRRILVAPVLDVVPGTPVPRLDLSALNQFAETAMTPGQTVDTRISIIATGVGPGGWWLRWWWLILLLLLVIAIVLYILRRSATP
jgi:hypothetical protein